MKIGILTDSTSSLNMEFIIENNIKVAHLYLLNGRNVYVDGLDITHEEINYLLEKGELFTTSQPTTDDFIKLYKEFKEEGYSKVFAIHVSGSLSGTIQNSKIASDIVGVETVIIDSCTGGYALKKMIEKTVELLKDGKDIEYVKKEIIEFKNKSKTFAVPYSLKQLEKSGRASSTQFLVTNILNIKILFELENYNGTLKIIDKIRTEKKVLKKLEDLLRESLSNKDISEVGLMHVSNREFMDVWKLDLEYKFPNIHFEVINLTPVVGVHTGIGTIAISF